MTIQIDVWSDFVCPYCYAVSFDLDELQQKHDVHVRWRAFELRPKDAPPPPPDYVERVLDNRPLFAATMWEMRGIEIDSGPFGIDSRAALVGFKYADSLGMVVGAAYHKTVFDAYWQHAANLEDADTLTDLAVGAGINADDFRAALEDETYRAQFLHDVLIAQQIGINAVPSMLLERKYLVIGAQPYEALAQVVKQLQEGDDTEQGS